MSGPFVHRRRSGLAAAASCDHPGSNFADVPRPQENEQPAGQRRQLQWLAASIEVTQQLLLGNVERPLDLVLRFAVQGAAADFGMLVMPEEHRMRVRATRGDFGKQLDGRVLDPDTTVCGRVIRAGKPIAYRDFADDGARGEDMPAGIAAVLAAPLPTADQEVIGALAVGRATGRTPFDEDEGAELAGFATHAGFALSVEDARAGRELARLLADHDRIAADLHNHVIRELFAVGIGLQGLTHSLERTEDQCRLLGYVESLDATIRRIRTTIFQLGP